MIHIHFICTHHMLSLCYRYSLNGVGIALFSVLSEGQCSQALYFFLIAASHVYLHVVLEMLAQCQMIWMLLSISVGWTISPYSTHPIRDKKQLLTNMIVAAMHVSIVSTFQRHRFTV